jgi:hypothetical protein
MTTLLQNTLDSFHTLKTRIEYLKGILNSPDELAGHSPERQVLLEIELRSLLTSAHVQEEVIKTIPPVGNAAGRPPGDIPRWNDTGYSLPEEGERVLHMYDGVCGPVYGVFRDGRFWSADGRESRPTTHWLRVPVLGGPPLEETP